MNNGIQFGGDPDWYGRRGIEILDNGRVIERTVTLPELGDFAQVEAQLNIWAESDPWDRAGSVYLATPAGDVELEKFITGFGGTTSWTQDVTHLLPLLQGGPITVRAFIDTWVQEAWRVDFNLRVTQESPQRAPVFARTVFNDQDWRAGEFPDNRRRTSVIIPEEMGKVVLNYLPSGHAIDGQGGDEFTQRTHHILIDGEEVWSGIPWRTDGRDFRSVNPTSGRWGDTWSSDLNRAGWIPGDDVDPIQIDVTEYMGPGRHRIDYQIDGIRADDGSGYGYWRVSSSLTGWALDAGPADFNYDAAVDGTDFLMWQAGAGRTGEVNNGHGDADRNGTVDGADLSAWNAAFGSGPATVGILAVPEPASAALAAAIFAAVAAAHRRWL